MPKPLRTATALILGLLAVAGLSVLAGPAAGNGALPTGTTGPEGPDAPGVKVSSAQVREGDRGTRPLVMRVKTDGPLDAPVTLRYRVKPGSAKLGKDFKAPTGKVKLKGSRGGKIKVPVRGDRRREAKRETFTVSLRPNDAVVLDRGSARGTIIDDD